MNNAPEIGMLWAALPEARMVGGAVRDALAGVPVADVDFASPLTPEAVRTRLAAAGIKTVPTGLAHGTVTALIGGRGFEITTLRRDIATDGRHAVVAFTDDWREDAARRDFTINAMSMDRAGALHDYFGGAGDLHAGLVRFVGDAAARIEEDFLRILRFFRFFARYAKGAPDAEAVAAITALAPGIQNLSAERVWSELKRILAAPDPRAAIALMETSGVLKQAIPEGTDTRHLDALIARGAPADPLLRAAAILSGDLEAFATRLKLSGEEHNTLAAFRRPNAVTPASSDADLRRALADDPAETLMARAWLAQNGQTGWDTLRARLAATPRPVFPLQGRDLLALGIPPGPRIGQSLAAARAHWLATGCMATADVCLDWIRESAP